jgi:hypothetical protein
MKKIFSYTLILLIIISCKRKPITVEGYLIDEKTGSHFNPFSNAKVSLLDVTVGNSKNVASTTVDMGGHYKITTRYRLDSKFKLILNGNNKSYQVELETSKKMNYDFIIPCSSNLTRTYCNLSAIALDSIIIYIKNSKGENKLIDKYGWVNTPFQFVLQGEEYNYITSKIYSNGLFSQNIDSIKPDCRTTLSNQTINF